MKEYKPSGIGCMFQLLPLPHTCSERVGGIEKVSINQQVPCQLTSIVKEVMEVVNAEK